MTPEQKATPPKKETGQGKQETLSAAPKRQHEHVANDNTSEKKASYRKAIHSLGGTYTTT
jgi:hypothetical protein